MMDGPPSSSTSSWAPTFGRALIIFSPGKKNNSPRAFLHRSNNNFVRVKHPIADIILQSPHILYRSCTRYRVFIWYYVIFIPTCIYECWNNIILSVSIQTACHRTCVYYIHGALSHNHKRTAYLHNIGKQYNTYIHTRTKYIIVYLYIYTHTAHTHTNSARC